MQALRGTRHYSSQFWLCLYRFTIWLHLWCNRATVVTIENAWHMLSRLRPCLACPSIYVLYKKAACINGTYQWQYRTIHDWNNSTLGTKNCIRNTHVYSWRPRPGIRRPPILIHELPAVGSSTMTRNPIFVLLFKSVVVPAQDTKTHQDRISLGYYKTLK